MSDKTSGEWLTTKDKRTPKLQNKTGSKKLQKKTVAFKNDHIPTVHMSFSNTPPTPSTKQAFQRKKQSKLDVFFKPIETKPVKDSCIDQHSAEYCPIEGIRQSKKRQHCQDSPEQISGPCAMSEDDNLLKVCEESTHNNNIGDTLYNISGFKEIGNTTFASEDSSSSLEDELDFSPVIHVNSQVKFRSCPLSKRLKVSSDSEELLDSHSPSDLAGELHKGMSIPPSMSQYQWVDEENHYHGVQVLSEKQTVSESETCGTDQETADIEAEYPSDGFTPQELSEIPPFTFNQKSRLPHHTSTYLTTGLDVQKKRSSRTDQFGCGSDFQNEDRNLTVSGVDCESLGFTQWVQKQGERCRRIQNEVRLLESQDLLINNPSDIARGSLTCGDTEFESAGSTQ